GDKTSYMYRSTGSWLRIAFYSDPLGGTRRGFNASYKAVNSSTFSKKNRTTLTESCTRRHMYESEGEIFTPGEKCFRPFMGDMECSWDIYAQEGKIIELFFETYYSDSCIFEFVKIIDETGEMDEQHLCANSPNPIASAGPWLRVEYNIILFKRAAFWATYKAVNKKECRHPFYLNSSHGNFTSPRYLEESCNNVYPNSENCTWEIDVGDGMEIELLFNEFRLEPSDGCENDFVKLNDGHRSIKLCGDKESYMYRSTGSWLRVNFLSDSDVPMRGFHASYRAVPARTVSNTNRTILTDSCTKRYLYESTGEISSPAFKCFRRSTRNMECSWDIHVQKGKVVELIFDDFYISSGGVGCIYDFVNLTDEVGRIEEPHSCENFGAFFPRAVKSAGPWLHVEYSTSSSRRGGFQASYRAVDKRAECNVAPKIITTYEDKTTDQTAGTTLADDETIYKAVPDERTTYTVSSNDKVTHTALYDERATAHTDKSHDKITYTNLPDDKTAKGSGSGRVIYLVETEYVTICIPVIHYLIIQLCIGN
ncbi:unnamed protein product, partial [Owenia fusiformis]